METTMNAIGYSVMLIFSILCLLHSQFPANTLTLVFKVIFLRYLLLAAFRLLEMLLVTYGIHSVVVTLISDTFFHLGAYTGVVLFWYLFQVVDRRLQYYLNAKFVLALCLIIPLVMNSLLLFDPSLEPLNTFILGTLIVLRVALVVMCLYAYCTQKNGPISPALVSLNLFVQAALMYSILLAAMLIVPWLIYQFGLIDQIERDYWYQVGFMTRAPILYIWILYYRYCKKQKNIDKEAGLSSLLVLWMAAKKSVSGLFKDMKFTFGSPRTDIECNNDTIDYLNVI